MGRQRVSDIVLAPHNTGLLSTRHPDSPQGFPIAGPQANINQKKKLVILFSISTNSDYDQMKSEDWNAIFYTNKNVGLHQYTIKIEKKNYILE